LSHNFARKLPDKRPPELAARGRLGSTGKPVTANPTARIGFWQHGRRGGFTVWKMFANLSQSMMYVPSIWEMSVEKVFAGWRLILFLRRFAIRYCINAQSTTEPDIACVGLHAIPSAKALNIAIRQISKAIRRKYCVRPQKP
jgi:hypothetical protein